MDVSNPIKFIGHNMAVSFSKTTDKDGRHTGENDYSVNFKSSVDASVQDGAFRQIMFTKAGATAAKTAAVRTATFNTTKTPTIYSFTATENNMYALPHRPL